MGDKAAVKIAIYARVSLGASHGQSIDSQLLQLREYATSRGWIVYDEYADICSGVREKRPALDRLLKDSFHRKFQVVLVAALDRCSRSVSHMLGLVDQLQHNGVSLVSIREQLDLSGPQGRLILTVCSALAAMERDILRDRVKTGMAMKKLAAEKMGAVWRCGRAPISHDVIQEVVRLRREGLSLREIAKSLNKQVSRSSISRILKEQGLSQGAGKAPVSTVSKSLKTPSESNSS